MIVGAAILVALQSPIGDPGLPTKSDHPPARITHPQMRCLGGPFVSSRPRGCGDKDSVFDHRFLDEWMKVFPEAEFHRYDDGGHYILEDYADGIALLIRDFIGR